MEKTYQRPKKYQVEIPAKLRKKLACMQKILILLQELKSLLLNIRNILLSEPQLTLGRRSAIVGDLTVIKRIGRPNLLDSDILKKVKNIVLETRMTEGEDRHQQASAHKYGNRRG